MSFAVVSARDVMGDQDRVVLRGAAVDSRSWIVLHEGQAIIPWVLHNIKTIAWRPFTNANRLVPPMRVHIAAMERLPRVPIGRVCLIGGNTNLYHCITDYFANLMLHEAADPALAALPVLVDGKDAWQRALLDCYAPAGHTVISARSDALFEVDELHLTRKCFDFEGRNLVPAWFDWVRARTAHLDRAAADDTPERLYISRNRARSRRVENEADLQARLARLGFVTIHPETLPMAEQIRLFRGARVVVGPTGAAFANIAHARPGTVLVEFMPKSSWMPPQIEYLARAAGIDHSLVLCPGKFEDLSFPVDPGAVEAHLASRMAAA